MRLAFVIFFILIFVLAFASTIGFRILFFILGVLIAVAINERNKALKKNINNVQEETLHVVNLEKGGVFELRGVGKDSQDMTLTVLARHLYQEDSFFWYELECDKGSGDKVWVEVEDDDETQVTVVLEKKKLGEINTTPDKLKAIDDEEYGFIGEYKYQDSGNAVFYRFCDDKRAEKLYYWDFKSGNKMLSIEKWGDGNLSNNYDVYISQIMKPSQITVLRNKA